MKWHSMQFCTDCRKMQRHSAESAPHLGRVWWECLECGLQQELDEDMDALPDEFEDFDGSHD